MPSDRWVAAAFAAGAKAAINTIVNGVEQHIPDPDHSDIAYRIWWWRGYYFQCYKLENPEAAPLTLASDPFARETQVLLDL